MSSDGTSLTSRAAVLAWRLLAYSLDCLLLFVFVLLSQFALIGLGLHPFIADLAAPVAPPSPGALHWWVSASTTLPFIIYFALGFASLRGATLGQRLAGLRVTATGGRRLPAGPALLRAAVLLVPFELNHLVMFRAAPWSGGPATLHMLGTAAVALLCLAYLILPLARSDGRSVHDVAAGSRVERARHS